ncbi:hypothetical protein O3P69_003826 [Scylla paramamosain]|uniref:Transposase n=1 Tax=Scylla paramamosain TaxID=85552 RepID=A0AAW0UDG5_SCYPA
MPHRMTLSSTGIVSSSVVGHRWKRLPFPGDHSPLLMKTSVEVAILEDRHITVRQLAQDVKTKAQSKQWKHYDSPPPKKACVQPSAGKVMLTIFWDQRGVVMMDFLAKGITINGTYYASLLQKLREAIKTERRGMLTKGVRLLQDNARFTTRMLPRRKHGPEAMKFFLTPLLSRPRTI